ncbi:DDB1-and CUL4-associated factor 13 AltName: Full=WD repeat and SOF domain-containing protein 1 [Rhizoctonia solani AG-1 IB]|uniref:Rhizoctonia solani AG1-IB WGS project CAOJ00000000 data, isolate 7/3/14, contig 19330 n=2 Tax=Thanatephorus cucumeris (strain AG1-IB / isolate 7/3/14) TaxID=1108050 RepID=M5CFC6_THACB|nr:DDB1-and CUL4-associated factor 13 AltName: Full=WD repeat and SOF domain-containing protein 1 [Rhizoctonia solani AG-1 IB]
MFSKPFVASLEGHIDGVYTLATKAGDLETITSGSSDGEVIVHDLASQQHLLKFPGAHKGTVSAITYADGPRLLSCGVDRTVKLWDTSLSSGEEEAVTRAPLNVFPGKVAFNAIDHHRTDQLFATASNIVQLWDETKSSPISDLTFPTSNETVTALRFNLSESSILATTGTDRTLTLYDIRTGKAERRLVMQMRANALSWSPTFPTTLLLASEDHNLYTFDVRSLTNPTQIYKGHVAAVMSCGWSPTGQEFVSGGWDRTVRIWKEGEGSKPVVYTGKRMQRVFATTYTQDARFILSGSDDGNVRLWKARASEKLGVVEGREHASKEYRDRLRERWSMDKEIGRIERQQNLPVAVKKAGQLKRTMLDARSVKEERRRKHTRAGASKPKAERKKVVVVEQT